MVRREDNRVWIDGAKETFHRHFEDMKAGQGPLWGERSDTYMYLTQMRVAGWDVEYEDLIAIAGYGPSFAYAPRPEDKWGAHYLPIKGRDERIAHATGYLNKWHQYKDIEDYWEALKAAIDAGRVVHAPNEEDVLFVGYVDADRVEDRKVLPVAIVFVEDDEWTWEQFTQWYAKPMVNGWLGVFEKEVAPWPARASVIEVIENAIDVATGNDPRASRFAGVTWGADGIAAYARDLADLSKSGAMEGGFFQGGWRGCHNVYPQMSGRPAMAAYLKRVAPYFEDGARRHIEDAALAYQKAAESWTAYDKALGRALPEDKHPRAWEDAAARKAGSDAVSKAAEHEREGVAALKRAMNSGDCCSVPATAQIEGVAPDPIEQTGSSFGRGLAMMLRHAGCDVDYNTVMGDIGQAFATQGTTYDPDLTGGYADIGWWPLDLFHMEDRLPHLSRVNGRTITCQWADFPEVAKDPRAFYEEHFKSSVQAEIMAGRPVLSVWHGAVLVTAYDTEDPPLQGWCVQAGKAEYMRVDDYPKAIYTYGDHFDPMNRMQADRSALEHAIALGRGTARTEGLWVLGEAAWKGWEDHLIQRKGETPHYWHANQRKQLLSWRQSAVAFLDEMSRRHDSSVSAHLSDAIRAYEEQIDCLKSMVVTKEAIVDSEAGRAELAARIRKSAALDMKAIDALVPALAEIQIDR